MHAGGPRSTAGVNRNAATIVSTALITDAGLFLSSIKSQAELAVKPLFWGQAHARD